MKLKQLNIFWKEVFLFFLTQALGIFVAIRLSRNLDFLKIKPEPISFLNFLVYFLIGTAIVLTVLKISKKRSGILLQIFFILAVFSGLDILFSIFIAEPGATILAAALLTFRFLRPTILFHNLVVIGGLAGIGGVLGLTLIPRDVIILLIILAVYDVISVYKTKHMIKIAQEMIKKRVILGIIIPEKISGFHASMIDVEKEKIPTVSRRKISADKIFKPTKKIKFMVLGGGDLALPLLLIVSVVRQSIWQAIIILVFAILGLFAMHLIFIKLKSRPMPALPPLAIFSILGYLVSLLI